MKGLYLVSAIILFSCFSCKRLWFCKDKKLNITRTEYLGDELRIDGFYYGAPEEDYQGKKFYEMFVLYKNGVLIISSIGEHEKNEEYLSEFAKLDRSGTKYLWGVFKIEGKSIKIEHWLPSMCVYPAVLKSGKILNDTTFVLTKKEVRSEDGTEEVEIKEKFCFSRLKVKPSNNNNFID